ncbi:DUF2690 domain-containing protein [Streptomyces albus]|uniref:helix-turn-helix domain-containing protein n=1 Tax=Streptomyces albus TaxID=1888 RepID=UPI0033FCE6C0
MPRWRSLPEDLDPQIREFASQLRRLVDRSGLSISALADRTGYSKSSWERYLNGRLLPPRGATQALAEVTGTDVRHLGTMWELAERAWSRSEMRHDTTLEAIRIAQARAALDEAEARESAPDKGRRRRRGKGGKDPAGHQDAAPYGTPGAQPQDEPTAVLRKDAIRAAGSGSPPAGPWAAGAPGAHGPGVPHPLAPPDGAGSGPGAGRGGGRQGGSGGGRRKVTVLLAALVAVLVVVAGAVLFLGPDDGGEDEKAAPKPSPTRQGPKLPAGVKCVGEDCSGKDPEAMGCGGQNVRTVGSAKAGAGVVEVRYSKVCSASWARVSGVAPDDVLRITAPGGQKETDTVTSTDAYTEMVSVKSPDDARACLTRAAGGESCT